MTTTSLYDPEYVVTRPQRNAQMIINQWGKHKATMRVLDYGGGNDDSVPACGPRGSRKRHV